MHRGKPQNDDQREDSENYFGSEYSTSGCVDRENYEGHDGNWDYHEG